MFCPSCGNQPEEKAAFCGRYGKSLLGGGLSKGPKRTSPTVKKHEYWIVGIVLTLFVGAVIALVVHVVSQPESNSPKANSGPPAVPPPPVPLTPQQRKAQEKEKLAQTYRIGTCPILESELVKGGYDVHVGFVGEAGSTHIYIMGEPVNRVFIYQLTGADMFPDFRRVMKRYGFTKITFMKSRTEWVGEYDVAANTIRTDPR